MKRNILNFIWFLIIMIPMGTFTYLKMQNDHVNIKLLLSIDYKKLRDDMLIILIFFFLILVAISFINELSISYKEKKKRKSLLNEKINKYLPNLNRKQLLDGSFKVYKILQQACEEYNLKTIDKYTTDELCEEYTKHLDKLKSKHIKIQSKEINLEDIELIDIKKIKNLLVIVIYIQVSSNIILLDDNNIIIKDNQNKKTYISNMLTFIKYLDICSVCGVDIKNNSTGECYHCNTKLVKHTSNWLLAKREFIDKKRH